MAKMKYRRMLDKNVTPGQAGIERFLGAASLDDVCGLIRIIDSEIHFWNLGINKCKPPAKR